MLDLWKEGSKKRYWSVPDLVGSFLMGPTLKSIFSDRNLFSAEFLSFISPSLSPFLTCLDNFYHSSLESVRMAMDDGATTGDNGGIKQIFAFQGQEQSNNEEFCPCLFRKDNLILADQDTALNKRKGARGESKFQNFPFFM